MVMAIDFGTTFSGYAYSWRSSKKEIFTHYWEKSNIKTPTIVLMDPQMKFHSFGQEAKDKYLDLIKKCTHREWYYFEHFKMKLFVQEGVSAERFQSPNVQCNVKQVNVPFNVVDKTFILKGH